MTRFLLLLSVLSFAVSAEAREPIRIKGRPVVGWVEKVKLQDVDLTLKARMDTGAGLSSVHASIIKVIPPSDGRKERIIFQISDNKNTTRTLEREVIEYVNIKKKGEKGFIPRPVVRLDFCLGGKQIEGRVNLADREEFLYPLLIGRNILKTGDFLIDATRTFTHAPGCGAKKDR